MIAGCGPLYLPHRTNLIGTDNSVFLSISKNIFSLETCRRVLISCGMKNKFEGEGIKNVVGRK